MKNIYTLCLLFYVAISSAQCFQIEQILVDACDNNNDEGQNEMVRFVVGANSLSLNNFSVNWPFATWLGLIQNATTASKVALLNADIQAAGGCGQILQPTNNTLPANSKVILVTGLNFDTAANSFGSLNETIYMIFQNNPNITVGHFVNYDSAPALRTLTISFGNACSDTVTYERSFLVESDAGEEDGATVQFSASGIPTYVNNGCVAPVEVFSAEILTESTSLCAGQSINLSGNAVGFDSVNWTTNVGSILNNDSLNTSLEIPENTNESEVTVTFTATNSCGQTLTENVVFTINDSEIPTFSLISSVCQGGIVPNLPNLSTNGISGTWMPANIDNTMSNTYTFTPNAAENPCASEVSFFIEVLTDCTFNAYATAVWIDSCETESDGTFFNVTGSGEDLIGDVSSVFPTTDLGVFQQNANSLILRGAEVKTFKTGNSDVCQAQLFYRVYPEGNVSGTFTAFNLNFFDDCDVVAGSFPSGGPCQEGNQKWQTVLNDAQNPIDLTNFPAGNYVLEIYFQVNGTFNLGTNPCNDVVLVNNNGANYSATFSVQETPTIDFSNPTFCDGNDGFITISGLNPSTSFSLIYDYQSIPQTSMDVVSDENGQFVINSLSAGMYDNFVLSSNGCEFLPNAIAVLVNPVFTPVFDTIAPICVGEPLNPLPTISTNGISGSWLPALNNLETTTYTFTPDSNQCASETTITITVNPLNNPAFDFGNALTLCPNDDFSLPEISSNGIEGSWLPNEVDFTQNQTYIFTPFDNVCANNFSLEININQPFDVVINQACFDSDFTLFVADSSNQNLTFAWFNELGINIGNDSNIVIDETGEFTLEATLNGCTQAFSVSVLNIYCDIPKGVSPNNDTYNDSFDLSNFEVSNLQIYNRYGLEVYQKTNYTNEWVGNSNNGDELPSATYFYVVSFQSGQQKSGWVYLNREN